MNINLHKIYCTVSKSEEGEKRIVIHENKLIRDIRVLQSQLNNR